VPPRVSAAGADVQLPAGWDDRTMMTLIGPRGETGFAANVVITREPLDGKSLAEYVAQQAAAMKAELPGYALLDERTVQLRGAPTAQRLHRFHAAPNAVQQMQTFVLCRSDVFVITCSAQVQEFDALLPAFREILDSFRVDANAE
jgi:hypothetical protein